MRSLPPLATVPPIVYGLVVLVLSSCVSVPDPGSLTLDERLRQFPREDLPLYGATEIRFDDHAVPYVITEDERDVPFALGLVHAHLRLAQMEFLRHVSQARLSEMAGPFTRDIDASLRILDLDRAVPAMAQQLPPESRLWLERFAAGVNTVRDRLDELPPEFGFLGFERTERWTIEDSLTIGRLAGADINWAYWFRAFSLEADPRYSALAERLAEYQRAGTPSFGPETPTPLDVLMHRAKSGSNCFVISGVERDRRGAHRERPASRGAAAEPLAPGGVPHPRAHRDRDDDPRSSRDGARPQR